MSETKTGRTKEDFEYLRTIGEKHSEYMKSGGSTHAASFITEEGRKRQAEKIRREKNYFWKGGISFEPYGLEFNEDLKNLVRKRDDYICQLCGDEGNIVHHIDYNKKNNSNENLITLCKSCHTKTTLRRKEFQPFLELYMVGKYGGK